MIDEMDPDAKELLDHAVGAVAAMRRMDKDAASLFGGGMVAVLNRELRRRLGKLTHVDIALDHGAEYMDDLHAQVMVEDGVMKVGDRSGWRDGDETDRVFAWYELDALRVALDESESGPGEQP